MPSSHSIRVIVVDDEEDFRDPVRRFLEKRGMTVLGVGRVEDLLSSLSRFRPDIIVLDINLPGRSGLEAVEQLRRDTDAGIIMATARRGVDDRIHGLSLGADSYMEKPLDVRELEVVIRNLWARVSPQPAPEPAECWLFSPEDWTLAAPDGVVVRLSAAEYTVVTCLARQPGIPVSRDALFAVLGKPCSGPDDRSLDVLASRLRRKFAASDHPFPLKSVRSVGYVLTEIRLKSRPS